MSILDLTILSNSFWCDGGSRSCLIIHGVFARVNPFHCPYTTYQSEPVDKGDIKVKQMFDGGGHFHSL